MYNSPWMHFAMIENRGRELRKQADAYRLAKLARPVRPNPTRRAVAVVTALMRRMAAQRPAPVRQTREVERIRSSQADLMNKPA